MSGRQLTRELRHPLAAVLGVAGIVVATVAALGTPATAADGDLTATVPFDCVTVVSSSNSFDWDDAQVTLQARRPAGSTTVTVTAKVSDMPGISPVPMNGYDGTDQLVLDLAGAATTLTGSGKITNGGANQPIPMPEMRADLTSSAATLAVTVTSLKLVVSGITTTCTPASGAAMGALTVVEGAAPTPTPTPTPTTTTSATATPTPSAPATKPPKGGSGSSDGKPATGKVAFACALNIGSKFDWKPTVAVSGYRESAGDPVSLVATMDDLPGIAPVPIQGPMDFTLDVSAGGAKMTMTSTGDVDVQPNQDVPVTDLTGSLDADGDEMAIAVTGFTFDFPSGGVGAKCTAAATSLGEMSVGSEAVEVDDSDSGSDSGSGSGGDSGSPSSGGSLPQTGGGDALPVVALWAVALSLLGAALLLMVPGANRRKA